MSEIIGSQNGIRAAHELAGSALPNAPIVADEPHARRTRTTRMWTAARLRGLARGTYHLANRVDPVRLPNRTRHA